MTAWHVWIPLSNLLVRGLTLVERRDWRGRHGSSKVHLYGMLQTLEFPTENI